MVTPAISTSKNRDKDLASVEDIDQMWSVIKDSQDPEVDPLNPWFAPVSVVREDWYETLPAGDITIISGGLEIFEGDILKLSQLIKVNDNPLPNIIERQY
jgi:hypothetical protein